VAFGAITLSGPAKGFLAVMAGPVKFTGHMIGFGHLGIFFHLEDFRMTFRAFQLMGFRGVAEEDRPCASLRLKFYVPSAYFLLRSGTRAQGYQAYDANQDGENKFFLWLKDLPNSRILFLVIVYP